MKKVKKLLQNIKNKLDEKYKDNENYYSLSRILPYFKPYTYKIAGMTDEKDD